MTPYTPDTIRNIARVAGSMPPQEIAERLGLALSFVERVAREQGFDLRIREAPPSIARQFSAAGNEPRHRSDLREVHFTVNLRAADASLLRAKAAQRFTNPSRLLAQVFEGALARGKVDEMVAAANDYRPVDTAPGTECLISDAPSKACTPSK